MRKSCNVVLSKAWQRFSIEFGHPYTIKQVRNNDDKHAKSLSLGITVSFFLSNLNNFEALSYCPLNYHMFSNFLCLLMHALH